VLAVHCLGGFDVYQDDAILGHWPNRRPKAIFQYLVAHRARPVPKEVLMDVFWPEASASAARNSLNVAVYALRRRLRKAKAGCAHVLFREECYLLNPDLDLWVDVEQFDRLVVAARSLERGGRSADSCATYKLPRLSTVATSLWTTPTKTG
jgi:two-component SAPR family response regulator